MKRIKYIIVFLLLSLSNFLNAKTITIDSIKFQSKDSSLIEKYIVVKDQYQEAHKHYDSICENYSNNLATIDDYTKAKNDSSAAYEKMIALESKLDIVPTIPEGEPSEWSREELRQQYKEARKLRDLLPVIKKNSKNKNDYEKRLQNMLSRFKGHAAESYILIALGELNENSTKKAIKYFEEATKCIVQSDEWDFQKQIAWQKIAEIYEKNRQFQEAVKALENWAISEPCGTGANSSLIMRTFKILELKLYYKPENQIFRELWQELESEHIIYGIGITRDGLAQQIRILYGQERLVLLKNAVKEFRLLYPEQYNDFEIDKFLDEGYQFTCLLTELESHIQLIEQIENASLQETLEILETVRGKKGAPHVHGSLNDLNVPSKNISTRYWREEVLITKLISFHVEKSVPALIESDSKKHECCILYALGKLGGKDTIQYLKYKIKTEPNVHYLKDYHFCLLLTGNKEAISFVKEAASQGSGNNRAAAEWALSNIL